MNTEKKAHLTFVPLSPKLLQPCLMWTGYPMRELGCLSRFQEAGEGVVEEVL